VPVIGVLCGQCGVCVRQNIVASALLYGALIGIQCRISGCVCIQCF